MKRILFIAFFAFHFAFAQAQQDTTISSFNIEMDEVVVGSIRGGWDVGEFIRRVRTDTTFYKAFKSLRVVSFNAVNDIRIFNKRGGTEATYFSRTRTNVSNGCRTMQTSDERVTGDFFKRNKDYRYYTAELYAYLFFTKGRICGDNDIVGSSIHQRGSGSMEKAKYQLKQLIFNPGSKISGVPLMGNKAAIFDPPTVRKYDFKLMSVEYAGESCYLFRALPKKEYADDVVYNELSTWFRKSDYAILARDYSLSFSTPVYDFDVKMRVRLQPMGSRLLPTRIEYDGNWRVATQGRERGKFTTVFSY
jgi:hypothetical protein